MPAVTEISELPPSIIALGNYPNRPEVFPDSLSPPYLTFLFLSNFVFSYIHKKCQEVTPVESQIPLIISENCYCILWVKQFPSFN